MPLRHETRTISFRKEDFTYIHQYYECPDTHEKFTSTELDQANIGQVYSQYRAKYGIPTPNEIKATRKRYGLSASSMSSILGFGVNQYRLYENGDMPSETNGKILSSIQDPDTFLHFVNNAKNQFLEKEFKKMLGSVLPNTLEGFHMEWVTEKLYAERKRSLLNGYASQNPDKLKNILLYFLSKGSDILVQEMNRLLFYSDFLCFKRTGCALTGFDIRSHGSAVRPPVRWDRIYGFFDGIHQEMTLLPNGGVSMAISSKDACDTTAFSDIEICTMEKVFEKVKECTAAKSGEWESVG